MVLFPIRSKAKFRSMRSLKRSISVVPSSFSPTSPPYEFILAPKSVICSILFSSGTKKLQDGCWLYLLTSTWWQMVFKRRFLGAIGGSLEEANGFEQWKKRSWSCNQSRERKHMLNGNQAEILDGSPRGKKIQIEFELASTVIYRENSLVWLSHENRDGRPTRSWVYRVK